jgi:hypothetical protein
MRNVVKGKPAITITEAMTETCHRFFRAIGRQR